MTEETQVQDVQAEQEVEKQPLVIGEKKYDPDSITEDGRKIMEDLYKVDGQLNQHQLTVSIISLAKQKLIEELEKEAVNFVEIFDAEPVDETVGQAPANDEPVLTPEQIEAARKIIESEGQ